MTHGICRSEVEAQAAHLCGEEHHVDGGVVVEVLHEIVPLPGRHGAVQPCVGDGRHVPLQEVLLDNVQHGPQLTEEQHPVRGHHGTTVTRGGANPAVQEQLSEGWQFGRHVEGVEFMARNVDFGHEFIVARMLRPQDKGRVVADQPEVLQRLEHVRLGHTLVLQIVSLACEEVLVQDALRGAQFAVVVLRYFWRELFEHVFLDPPHHEGERLSVQGLHRNNARLLVALGGLGVPGLQNWLGIFCHKLLLVAQVAGHEEVKERPQLQHVVLDWRAGENEPMAPHESFDGLVALCFGIFDDVALIKNNIEPVALAEEVYFISHNVVGHHKHVVLQKALAQPLSLCWRPGVVQGPQQPRRSIDINFVHPVPCESRRADHQRMDFFLFLSLVLVVSGGEDAEGLQGLAKAHVIAEDSMHPVVPEECQPVHARLLVVPERGAHRHRHSVVVGLLAVHELAQELPVLVPLLADVPGQGGRVWHEPVQGQQFDERSKHLAACKPQQYKAT